MTASKLLCCVFVTKLNSWQYCSVQVVLAYLFIGFRPAMGRENRWL